MSADEYDQAEQLFCGKWQNVGNENLDEFMVAAELPEAFRNALGKTDKITTISREGDDFHYKTHLGDVDVDLSEKIGVETEWDEKGKKPILHILTVPTFKDGVWVQDCKPAGPDDGKRYIVKFSRQGDEMIYDFSLPDDPSITARRHWKKC